MRTDTKIDQLSMNVITLTTSCQTQIMPPSKSSDSQQIRNNDQLVVDNGNDKDWHGIRKRYKPPKWTSVISFTLILPTWLAHRSLQIDVCRVAQSWTLSLRPYRTIPYDADIWKFISEGDFDRMRNLIESGQATVLDRNE